ncbi:MAG TPA: lipocalin-like domain-containing protein [Xanthobacteraceae bacterium]|nr:lipocalin-like domain-containing protein [Xanthobacteraceae bacterium]
MSTKGIIGTWRMVESRARDDAGRPLPPSYGPMGLGLVMFHAAGRMMCVLSDGRPVLPEDETAREYVSYGGSYTFDGKTLVTRVDVTSDPKRLGGDEVRQVRFEGERLVLAPPPRLWKGATQHRELVWERIG